VAAKKPMVEEIMQTLGKPGQDDRQKPIRRGGAAEPFYGDDPRHGQQMFQASSYSGGDLAKLIK
jgi:hypothetical protein